LLQVDLALTCAMANSTVILNYNTT